MYKVVLIFYDFFVFICLKDYIFNSYSLILNKFFEFYEFYKI